VTARRLLPIAACAGALAVAAAAAASPAAALVPNLTSGATAYSAAAATGSASLKANLQLTGSLGGLLDSLINPIVSADLNPLVGALQGTVNNLVAATLGAASPLNASTYPAEPQMTPAPAAFPNDPTPSPCLPSGAQPCYTAANATVGGAPLATVSAGVISGYVEQVMQSADSTNPVFGRASIANPRVSVLPGLSNIVPALPGATNPLVSAALVAAKANCPNDGAPGATKPATAPSASETVSNVTLLGGLVTFGVLDGQLTNLTVNGVSYTSVLSLPTVTVSGVTVAPFGQGVIVSIPLSVAQVLTALGLPSAVVNALNTFTPTSAVTLSLVVGPNATVTSRSVSAWGLGIGVNLSGSLTFNLLGLVTATVNIPTGIGGSNTGNLLDLRLAYATCQSGVNLPAVVPVVPPALV
jgi:hypothetical protein